MLLRCTQLARQGSRHQSRHEVGPACQMLVRQYNTLSGTGSIYYNRFKRGYQKLMDHSNDALAQVANGWKHSSQLNALCQITPCVLKTLRQVCVVVAELYCRIVVKVGNDR